ncbi:hypothetical protein NHJ6243_003582 [Beauveria neobassiana]
MVAVCAGPPDHRNGPWLYRSSDQPAAII